MQLNTYGHLEGLLSRDLTRHTPVTLQAIHDRQDSFGSHHGERSVDVLHLLHPAVEEIRVHDVYAQSTPLERHSYAQSVGLNPNAPEYTPCVAKTDADFLPDDYVSRTPLDTRSATRGMAARYPLASQSGQCL